MSSLEELKTNLQTYLGQQKQLMELLTIDPNNESYLKLQTDLNDAIRLTKDLISTHKSKESSGPSGDMLLRKGDFNFRVGTCCEAPYGDKHYPALIMSIDEDGGDSVSVRFLGYTEIETRPKSDLRPIACANPIDPSAVAAGFECQALWIGDGQWYEAAVLEVLDYGYKLKFTKYGNEAEVPFEYIRASGAAKAAEVDAAVAGQKRPAAGEGETKEGAGAFVIPMHLRVLPTDSEEERLRKRKRVKHLKAAAKKKDKGEDDAEQGKNWQDYLNKNKKPKGLGALRKQSIFATPDSVEGKVGVVGSGQGMTEYDGRKKYLGPSV